MKVVIGIIFLLVGIFVISATLLGAKADRNIEEIMKKKEGGNK